MKIQSINTYAPKNLNFKAKRKVNPYYEGYKIPRGANYEILKGLDSDLAEEKPEILINSRKGDILPEREKIFYSRIPYAINDAKAFVEEHPQFEYDDICQDLILILLLKSSTDIKVNDFINSYYGKVYTNYKESYFEDLIKKYNKIDIEPLSKYNNVI